MGKMEQTMQFIGGDSKVHAFVTDYGLGLHVEEGRVLKGGYTIVALEPVKKVMDLLRNKRVVEKYDIELL